MLAAARAWDSREKLRKLAMPAIKPHRGLIIEFHEDSCNLRTADIMCVQRDVIHRDRKCASASAIIRSRGSRYQHVEQNIVKEHHPAWVFRVARMRAPHVYVIRRRSCWISSSSRRPLPARKELVVRFDRFLLRLSEACHEESLLADNFSLRVL